MANCLAPGVAASQNWSRFPDDPHNRTGLVAPSGFAVCGSGSEIAVSRNTWAWVTSAAKHSWRGGTCLDYDPAAAVFRSTTLEGEPDLCLSIGPGIRPCDRPSPAAGFPMCDLGKSVAARATDLVARIPAHEKAAQLVNMAPAIDSLWIPRQNYWNEALHGMLSGGAVSPDGTVQRRPTEFPSALSSAASFNRSLFFGIGTAVGTEARVESNAGTSRGWTFWAPNGTGVAHSTWYRHCSGRGSSPRAFSGTSPPATIAVRYNLIKKKRKKKKCGSTRERLPRARSSLSF